MKHKIDKIELTEVKAQLGYPQESVYLGYGIHRPDTLEYAVLAIENEMESRWAWSKTPELAYKFHDYREVLRLVSEYTKAPLMIGLLFEHGNKIMFASINEAH
jgi:hypothetical protein